MTKRVKTIMACETSVGRPSNYRQEHCDRAVELGKEGKSKAQIAASLGCVRQTLDNWAEKYPQFLDALTRARDLSLSWWEDQGQKGIWSREFNANAFKLQVMNRFPDDYRDKTSVEHTGKDGGPIETTDTRDMARAVLEILSMAEIEDSTGHTVN